MSDWLTKPAATICHPSRNRAIERQQSLTKPLGSLGRLELLAVDFAGFQKTSLPALNNVAIRVFAGDHGVFDEGVSAFPQSVTGQMIYNFVSGGAAITVLARQHSADFSVINLGTMEPLEDLPRLTNIQIAPGTANFCKEPAMTIEQLDIALGAGRDSVSESAIDLFVGGEMGIGNTTAAAAIFCALLNVDVQAMVGHGTGVDDDGLKRKQQAVKRGLELHKHAASPKDVLQCFGGFEIAALVGAYIGNAQKGIPSLVDGYITTAAALAACRINPSISDWLLFSHCSAEAAHKLVMQDMKVEPLIDLEMRLGEASGAGLVIPLIKSALLLHSEMATFDEAGVSES